MRIIEEIKGDFNTYQDRANIERIIEYNIFYSEILAIGVERGLA